MRIVEYVLPAHWLCALINDDYSGLEEHDIDAIEAFYQAESAEYGMFRCLCPVDDKGRGFMRYHDAWDYGIGSCDTVTIAFQVE